MNNSKIINEITGKSDEIINNKKIISNIQKILIKSDDNKIIK